MALYLVYGHAYSIEFSLEYCTHDAQPLSINVYFPRVLQQPYLPRRGFPFLSHLYKLSRLHFLLKLRGLQVCGCLLGEC